MLLPRWKLLVLDSSCGSANRRGSRAKGRRNFVFYVEGVCLHWFVFMPALVCKAWSFTLIHSSFQDTTSGP